MERRVSDSDFDLRLLAHATKNWQKAARVIGLILMEGDDEHWPGDEFLATRLKALVAAGKLESQGDLTKIRFSEVRLPQKP